MKERRKIWISKGSRQKYNYNIDNQKKYRVGEDLIFINEGCQDIIKYLSPEAPKELGILPVKEGVSCESKNQMVRCHCIPKSIDFFR